MSAKNCSLKLRILILVVNSANLINERATPTLGISHALIAPTALCTIYVFIGVFVLGAIRQHYASKFLQIYALIVCCSIQISLSLTVFKELKTKSMEKHHACLVLNGVLPMINAVLLLIDLTGILLTKQEQVSTTSNVSQNRKIQK